MYCFDTFVIIFSAKFVGELLHFLKVFLHGILRNKEVHLYIKGTASAEKPGHVIIVYGQICITT